MIDVFACIDMSAGFEMSSPESVMTADTGIRTRLAAQHDSNRLVHTLSGDSRRSAELDIRRGFGVCLGLLMARFTDAVRVAP